MNAFRTVLAILLAAAVASPGVRAAGAERPQKAATPAKKDGSNPKAATPAKKDGGNPKAASVERPPKVVRPQKVPTLGKKDGGNRGNHRNNRNQKPNPKPAAKKTASGGGTVDAAGTGDRLEPVLTAPPSSTTASSIGDDTKIRQIQTQRAALQAEADALALVKERLVLSKWTPNQVVDEETGNTLLHQAAGNGYLSVVQYLLAEGADPTVRNKILQTPADLARALNRTDVEEALNAAAAKRRAPGA